MKQTFPYPKIKFSTLGITYIDHHHPLMVAWWSAVFPGFGHYILNQYVRATLFTLIEVIVNTGAHINEAMIYSYCGKFELAKAVIDIDWMIGYIILYLVTIGDSYRSAILMNKFAALTVAPIHQLKLFPAEIYYLTEKKAILSVIYSFLLPGIGQLYTNQLFLGIYAIIWWWIYLLLSHLQSSIVFLILGDINSSISILHPHWLMFMPSIVGGAVFHAHYTCRKHSKLSRSVQYNRLSQRYNGAKLHLFP